jgi:hypothetical protein
VVARPATTAAHELTERPMSRCGGTSPTPTIWSNDSRVSPSFGTDASTKLTTVATHSLARGAKRRGEVRRIASPRRPLYATPSPPEPAEQFPVRIPVSCVGFLLDQQSREEIRENELKRRDAKRLQQSF